MLPPGLARLATWPVSTGSAWARKTMGIEDVAAFRAPVKIEPRLLLQVPPCHTLEAQDDAAAMRLWLESARLGSLDGESS
jgi:hypothetical protein